MEDWMKAMMEEDGLRVTVEDIEETEGSTVDHPIRMLGYLLLGIGYSEKVVNERLGL